MKNKDRQINYRMKNKSQVTILIIIAVVIVAVVIIFFLVFNKTKPAVSVPSADNPEGYIEKCTRDAAEKAINTMLPQGGYINPANYRLYEDQKVAYLCYTNQFYKGCTIQEPIYLKHIEEEITSNITSKIDACFLELKRDLEKKDYSVTISPMKVATEVAPKVVKINIDRKLGLSRHGESWDYNGFKVIFNSPLYNLARTAQEIANEEAKFCNFEYVGFMLFYPDYNINKKAVGQGENASKIYTIGDRYTGKKLNMAVRSCAIPAGL